MQNKKTNILNTIRSPKDVRNLDKSQLSDNIAMKRSIDSIRDKLREEQLKIDSMVSEEVMVPFTDTHDQIQLNSYYLDNQLFVNIDVPNNISKTRGLLKKLIIFLLILFSINFSNIFQMYNMIE